MQLTEPNNTAFILTVLAVLLGLSVLFSRLAGRAGIPVALLFILLGMLAGSEGPGGVEFSDYGFAFRIGTIALVLILFDGGLNTPLHAIQEGIRPAAVLATVGVVFTATLTALAAKLFGVPWQAAMLLGAIVSSTDAAAVFSVLRGSGLALKRRVGATLELESGLNDPMAVILTMSMTTALIAHDTEPWRIVREAVIQMVVGGVLGVGIGYFSRWVLKRVRLPAAGLYPVLTLAAAFLAFGVPTLAYGSGFLAVYLAAVIIGNGEIRYRSGVIRVHDAIAWFAQVTMFLMLGLLAFPSELLEVWGIGLALGAVLAFVARPVAAITCLLPFRYRWSERLYIGWVGLRGAVPIILATFPVLSDAPGARTIFNVVFFVVVFNSLVPGATVPWLTRWLKLESGAPPAPEAVLEISSTHLLSGEVHGFYVDSASATCGASIADLPFPPSSNAAMLVRGKELLAPKGNTVLEAGDHVYVFCKPEDLPFIRLMFGQEEGA